MTSVLFNFHKFTFISSGLYKISKLRLIGRIQITKTAISILSFMPELCLISVQDDYGIYFTHYVHDFSYSKRGGKSIFHIVESW